ncbi:hypothetical protein Taro_013251, partial [Colocasia esculenta]|nr:hypothetical protein [Colocasia esculenta]
MATRFAGGGKRRPTHYVGGIGWIEQNQTGSGRSSPISSALARFPQLSLATSDPVHLPYLPEHHRFVQLLRHVPHVVSSEQACAERFIAGLRPDLRWGVTAHVFGLRSRFKQMTTCEGGQSQQQKLQSRFAEQSVQ